MSSTIFYPDADPESTSVDGYVEEDVSPSPPYYLSWADLVASPGNNANDDRHGGMDIFIYIASTSAPNTDKWRTLTRGIILFDTSSLADTQIISATLSLYCEGKYDLLSITPDINIYSSNPASNTALIAGDFDSCGSTAFSTTKTYGNITASAWNVFTLNSSGISAINKSGISKFSVRNANYDVANHAPSWTGLKYSTIIFDSADGTYAPKLTVEYISTPPVDATIAPKKVSRELIANIEMQFGGRFYIDKGGNATYESPYYRSS